MKVMALKQLQQQNPTMYNAQTIDIAAMKAMGWSNPEQFLAPPQPPGQMPPEVQKAMAELDILKQEADAKTAVAQASVQESQVDGQARIMDAQTKQMLAQAKVEQTRAEIGERGGEGEEPWHRIDAEAKMMDAETRRLLAQLKADEINLNAQKHELDSDHREADRIVDSHHRAADRMSRDKAAEATRIARTMIKPEGE